MHSDVKGGRLLFSDFQLNEDEDVESFLTDIICAETVGAAITAAVSSESSRAIRD